MTSFKNTPADFEASDALAKLIRRWEGARSAAANKTLKCPEWLSSLCAKMPHRAPILLAWLLDCTGYDGRGEFIITPRSPTWGQLCGIYLFKKVPISEISAMMGTKVRFVSP